MDKRFSVYVSDHDDGVFILDGKDPASSSQWLGVGFKTAATKNIRKAYADAMCELLNRGAVSGGDEHGA